MKISTVVDLELLRRYADLGHWNAATTLYFDTRLEDVDAASRDKLHEAVWARDSDAVAAVVTRLAGASRLMANHGSVKPLPPSAQPAKGAGEKRL